MIEKFETTENLSDMLGELSGLAKEIGGNEGTFDAVKKDLNDNQGHMTDTIACVYTSSLDKIYANKKKFNKLSAENQKFLELVVNNWRGEIFAENYNENYMNCRKKVKLLMDAI